VLIGCGWSLFFLALGLVVAERFWLDSGMVVVASLEPRQTPASFNPTKSSSNFCSRLTALKTVFSARFVFGGGLLHHVEGDLVNVFSRHLESAARARGEEPQSSSKRRDPQSAKPAGYLATSQHSAGRGETPSETSNVALHFENVEGT